jgi:hypothetical protein
MEEFYGVQRETAEATPTMIRVIRIAGSAAPKFFPTRLKGFAPGAC